MSLSKRFLASCALFAITVSPMGLMATPVLAQSTAADQAVADCHAQAWQPYHIAVTDNITSYANALRVEWRKRIEAAVSSGRTKAIQASRARTLERGRVSLEKAIATFQINLTNVVGKDDRRLAEVASESDADAQDQSYGAWANRAFYLGNFDATLASLDGILRRNVNTRDLRAASQSWRSTRQNAWQQLLAETKTLRENYLDDVQACLNELEVPATETEQSETTPANTAPQATPANSVANQSSTDFAVTSMTIGSRSVDANKCEASVITTAKITVNAAGFVKYAWVRSDTIVSTVDSVKFEGAGTKEVSLTWQPGKNANGGYSGWAQLKILSPNLLVSDQSGFSAACGTANNQPAIQPAIPANTNGQVTGVRLSVSPEKTATCPQLFQYDGSITTDGPAKVVYTWDRSDGAIAPIETMIFSGAGTQKIQSTWWLGRSYDGWRVLRVISPNQIKSDPAQFSLVCPTPVTPPMAVTVVKAAMDPDSATPNVCQQTFTMRGTIQTNGAGKVRYRWERSDGSAYPEETIAFTAAGIKTVSDTWYLNAETKGWIKLHVLGPNDVSSDLTPFALFCPASTFAPEAKLNADVKRMKDDKSETITFVASYDKPPASLDGTKIEIFEVSFADQAPWIVGRCNAASACSFSQTATNELRENTFMAVAYDAANHKLESPRINVKYGFVPPAANTTPPVVPLSTPNIPANLAPVPSATVPLSTPNIPANLAPVPSATVPLSTPNLPTNLAPVPTNPVPLQTTTIPNLNNAANTTVMTGFATLTANPTFPTIYQEYSLIAKIDRANLTPGRLTIVITDASNHLIGRCEKAAQCEIQHLKTPIASNVEYTATFSDNTNANVWMKSAPLMMTIK